MTSSVRWGAGCTWLDYDRDGISICSSCNYIEFDPRRRRRRARPTIASGKAFLSMCGRAGCPADTNILYHNNGDGTFTDVSAKAGILEAGSAVLHHRRVVTISTTTAGRTSMWPCDSEPSILFHNNHDGTFTDIAVMAGCRLQRGRT